MDTRSRILTVFLLVLNTVLVMFICSMFLNLRGEVRDLKIVLATKSDLQAVRTAGAKFSFQEEKCTRCHTERRFAGMHGTEDELLRIVRRMQQQPDSRITEQEVGTIHASLLMLKCAQCHSGEMMKRLSLKTEEERSAIIKSMQKKPGSEIAPEEVADIQRSFRMLIGF